MTKVYRYIQNAIPYKMIYIPSQICIFQFSFSPFFAILGTFSPITRKTYVQLTNKADHFNPLIELNLMTYTLYIYKFYLAVLEI